VSKSQARHTEKKSVRQQQKCGIQPRRTNHDEGIRYCGEDVDLALEDEREDGEDAAKEIDGHEEERDAEDGSVLVDLVELGSLSRQTQHGRGKERGWSWTG